MRHIALIATALLVSLSASPLLASDALEDMSSPGKLAKEENFGACAKLVDDIAISSVGKGPDGKPNVHSAFSTWSKTDTDKNLFSSIVVQPFSDGSTFTTIAVNPSSERGLCNAAYNRISLGFRSCTRVRETFAEWRLKHKIGKDGVVLEKEGSSNNIILLPQGDQRELCMIVNSNPVVNYRP